MAVPHNTLTCKITQLPPLKFWGSPSDGPPPLPREGKGLGKEKGGGTARVTTGKQLVAMLHRFAVCRKRHTIAPPAV